LKLSKQALIQQDDFLSFFQEQYRRARGSSRDIRPTDRLVDGLGIDSLLASELLIALEDRFGVMLLHDPRAWQLTTVQELLDLVLEISD
jgi:acyl carrier protein